MLMPKARASTDGVRVADFAFPEKNEILYKNCMFFDVHVPYPSQNPLWLNFVWEINFWTRVGFS